MSVSYLKEIKIYKRKGYNLSLKVRVSNSGGWHNIIKTFKSEGELDEHFKEFIKNFSLYDFIIVPFSQADRVLKYKDDIDNMKLAIKKGVDLYYLKDGNCYISKHLISYSYAYRYYYDFHSNYKDKASFLFTKEEAEKATKNLKHELELIPKNKEK